MHKIVLHGALRKQFGKSFSLDVKSVTEAVRALCVQIPGFRQALSEGHYRVAWFTDDGKKLFIPSFAIPLELGKHKKSSIHIIPTVAGGASLGTWLLIAGAVLVAAAFLFSPAIPLMAAGYGADFAAEMGATAISLGSFGSISYANIAVLGFGLMLVGAGMLLSPSPTTTLNQTSMFAVPRNTGQQGMSVPLIFGRFLVGSVTISTGIINANVPIGQPYYYGAESGPYGGVA